MSTAKEQARRDSLVRQTVVLPVAVLMMSEQEVGIDRVTAILSSGVDLLAGAAQLLDAVNSEVGQFFSAHASLLIDANQHYDQLCRELAKLHPASSQLIRLMLSFDSPESVVEELFFAEKSNQTHEENKNG